MNKRIRKKHAKQAWERMQKEIRDPAFWKRTDREVVGWLSCIVIDPLPEWFDRQYAEPFNLNYGVAQQEVQGSSYEIVKQFMVKYADIWKQDKS